jgi:uncharacterized protein YigE (DUF2233 family)
MRARVQARASAAIAACLITAFAAGGETEPDQVAAGGDWRMLEPGLEFAELELPVPSAIGDSRLTVLRIDTASFELKLLNATAPGQGQPLSAREWCKREGLIAAINASMYQTDFKTSIGLMRTASHVNNGHLNRDRAVLAFDRLSEEVSPVDIIDLTCQDFQRLRPKYGSMVQSIRMVSCNGTNTWQRQPRRWSTAAIAIDKQRHVLFLHCRSPYSTHDFIEGLLALPLEIEKAMYVEGGPEAQLYLNAGGFEFERVGSFESGFMESDGNTGAWPVPNVVAVVRRTRSMPEG